MILNLQMKIATEEVSVGVPKQRASTNRPQVPKKEPKKPGKILIISLLCMVKRRS